MRKTRCDWCGAKEKALEVKGRHIARIQLINIYLDGDPRNKAPGNVLTLCQDCSQKYEDEQNKAPGQRRLL